MNLKVIAMITIVGKVDVVIEAPKVEVRVKEVIPREVVIEEMKINIGGAIRKMIVTIAEVNVERIRQEEVDQVLEGIVVEVGERIIHLILIDNSQPNLKKNISIIKYKKHLTWPIKYIKHYKSIEYMKRTILSINMVGNEKQKTWQKNTLFKCKMLKVLCPC